MSEVLAHDPSGECQFLGTSRFASPGPVVDREWVARWIVTPAHVSTPLPGSLNSDTAFQELYTRGLSVQRIDCRWSVTGSRIHRLGERDAEKKRAAALTPSQATRKYLGCVKFPVSALRGLAGTRMEGETFAFRVYESALQDDLWHAEVMGDDTPVNDKNRKRMRLEGRVGLTMLAKTSGIYPSPLLDSADADLVATELAVRYD